MPFKDPEAQRNYFVQYREQHREILRERNRCFRLKNLDRLKQSAKEKRCRNWKTYKEYELTRKFGLSLAQYWEMWNAQGGLCANCRKPEAATFAGKVKLLAVDHNAVTGKIRQLLCTKCNTALGLLDEDPATIKSLLAYLEHHA